MVSGKLFGLPRLLEQCHDVESNPGPRAASLVGSAASSGSNSSATTTTNNNGNNNSNSNGGRRAGKARGAPAASSPRRRGVPSDYELLSGAIEEDKVERLGKRILTGGYIVWAISIRYAN